MKAHGRRPPARHTPTAAQMAALRHFSENREKKEGLGGGSRTHINRRTPEALPSRCHMRSLPRPRPRLTWPMLANRPRTPGSGQSRAPPPPLLHHRHPRTAPEAGAPSGACLAGWWSCGAPRGFRSRINSRYREPSLPKMNPSEPRRKVGLGRDSNPHTQRPQAPHHYLTGVLPARETSLPCACRSLTALPYRLR